MTTEKPEPTRGQGESKQNKQAAPVVAFSPDVDDPKPQPIPGALPILPIRGLVVFPGTVVPLSIRRPSSVKLLDDTLPQSKMIGLVRAGQRDGRTSSAVASATRRRQAAQRRDGTGRTRIETTGRHSARKP